MGNKVTFYPKNCFVISFDEAVKEFGFIKNEDEPRVYKKVSGSAIMFLVLYIDDILLIGNDICRHPISGQSDVDAIEDS